MLLVVTGAGASYDSCAAARPGEYLPGKSPSRIRDHRPPLTDDLFSSDRPYSSNMANYARMQNIVPELRRAVTAGEGLEAALSRIAASAKQDEEARRQLSAMRHYIRTTISETTSAWMELLHGVTAYSDLVEQVRRITRDSGRDAIFVTFNYDNMLDVALASADLVTRPDLDSYVNGPVRLVRPHGATDWFFAVETSPAPDRLRILVPPTTEQLDPDTIRVSVSVPGDVVPGERGRTLYPAVAIPVDHKTGLDFCCPSAHVERLADDLNHVTDIVSVGWRGAEPHMAEMLGRVHQDTPVWVASGPGGAETVSNFTTMGFTNATDLNMGFIDLLNARLARVLAGEVEPAPPDPPSD